MNLLKFISNLLQEKGDRMSVDSIHIKRVLAHISLLQENFCELGEDPSEGIFREDRDSIVQDHQKASGYLPSSYNYSMAYELQTQDGFSVTNSQEVFQWLTNTATLFKRVENSQKSISYRVFDVAKNMPSKGGFSFIGKIVRLVAEIFFEVSGFSTEKKRLMEEMEKALKQGEAYQEYKAKFIGKAEGE